MIKHRYDISLFKNSFSIMQILQRVLVGGFVLLGALGKRQAQLNGGAPVPYKVQKPPLDTDWTYKVGTNPWPEHPRPQLHRQDWQSLNGIWTYDAADSRLAPSQPPPSTALSREIMIPSCVESGLSGVQQLNPTNMWFARTFRVPDGWKSQNVLLNFEAVDYEATVFLNGVKVGHNVGGYFRFTIDITQSIKWGQENELFVFVYDPTDMEIIPVGKQTRNPSHIFYRSCSGIWQTVWMERAPANHITQLDVSAGMDGGGKLLAFPLVFAVAQMTFLTQGS